MRGVKGILTVLVTGVLSASVFGGATSTLIATRSKATAAVTLGKWHAGFSKCKSYATKNKVPLIAVWSNGDSCGHCVNFESSVNHSTFTKWMKSSGCVFYFTYSGDGGDGAVGSDVFHWIRNNKNTAYPFVRIYWPSGKVDIATVGDTIDKQKSGKTGASNAVAYFKAKLKNYKPKNDPVAPKYKGGSFAVRDGASSDNRLEAEVGVTTFVDVGLSRTNTVASSVATNTVVTTYPNGSVVTNEIDWASGDTAASIRLELDAAAAKVGERIEIILFNDAGKAVGTNHVTFVEEPENSPKNPRWIGERTSETLGWGEWTMDIDTATNKVNFANSAKGSKAHTLLLIGGPLWCPDCKRAEDYLVMTDAFRDWAKEARIACVAIDTPKFGKGYTDRPTLLTDKALEVNNICATGLVSGASYLSRKMVDPVAATNVLARNLFYVNNDTAHGGFCTPDNTAGAGNTGVWRTGIPCFVVLRDDGSVAGRLFQFSNSTADLEGGAVAAKTLVERLSEIVAQDGDTTEELNDSRYTTPEKIGLRETVEDRTLSFSDQCDAYALDPDTTVGQRVKVMLEPVKGEGFEPGTRLGVRILQASGRSVRTLEESVGALDAAGGVECATEIPSTNCYVVVDYPTDENAYAEDPQFSLTNKNSTLCHYTLKTDFVAVPTESNRTVTVADNQMMISLVSNKLYRLEGVDPTANADILEPLDGKPGLFRSLVTDDATLKLSAGEVSFQIWNTGKVGFVRTSGVVSEPASGRASYEFTLARTGGSSGTGKVTVKFNAEKSSALDNIFQLPDGFEEPFEWDDGEVGERTVRIELLDNPHADGDQFLYFDVEKDPACDIEMGDVQFKLTVHDNDKKVPGRLAIVGAEPTFASAMTVVQRAGGSVRIDVGRVDGTSGALAGSLATTAGALGATAFAWADREVETEPTELTVPTDAAGKKIVVTLTPAGGTAVDSACRKLTVNVIAADAPGFVTSATLVSDAVRYVPMTERRIALDGFATDATKIKKVSGTLAPGLSWKQDGGELVLSGVPTKAGSYTVVFRAHTGSTAGLTMSVTVEVADPVTTGGGEDGLSPLNASVAVSRTFKDIPVYDTANGLLAGVLDLTLPRTGRASAKFRRPADSVTLSCANWSAIDSATGALSADLVDMTGAFALAVTAAADGTVAAVLENAAEYPGGLVCDLGANVWSAKNPATDFKGYYTVSLPAKGTLSGVSLAAGAGFVTLKMNTTAAIRAGSVTYSGVYANGKAFSGTATLTAKDWNADFAFWQRAVLPLLVQGSGDSLACALEIIPGAYDLTAKDLTEDKKSCAGRCSYQLIRRSVAPAAEATPVWRHAEKSESATCEVALDAVGTWYTTAQSFADCCSSALGTAKLKFFALPGVDPLDEDGLEAAGIDFGRGFSDWEDAKSLAYVNVSYVQTSKKSKTKTNKIVSANTKALSLSFAASTGLVSGSFQMPFGGTKVKMTFKGVVMPGFGSSDCADCNMGGADALMSPFITGTAWFNDTLYYLDAKGRERSVTVRRSCPFSVGVNAGE